MTAIEIARQLAALGQTEQAAGAYGVAVHEVGEDNPAIQMEGAVYILQNGGDYKISYTWLLELYRRGQFREDCLSIMTQAFYEPNVKLLKTRYEKNCRRLAKYPYLFRKDFPSFEELPVRFYPFDDNGYVPFYREEERFGDYVKPRAEVISRNFFHDLENPILATDVFSQHELEYLNDNVRKSEWVARENHIYLHYSSWGEFCAWLQVLNLRPLTEEKKVVFLMEDELSLYPIDFKERFGIDYSQYQLKPVGIREINRLIWHTQLSSHNGGDFFNEIFDAHPNLITFPSQMLKGIEAYVQRLRESCAQAERDGGALDTSQMTPDLARLAWEVYNLKDRTDKDLLVVGLLTDPRATVGLDPAARIAPAVFLQPHFPNINFRLTVDQKGRTVLNSKEYNAIRSSPIFLGFKYIKTFTPLRRITTSYGAAVRFMQKNLLAYQQGELKQDIPPMIDDELTNRLMNRSFMVDPDDRPCQDSVLVRFEDAKLNPRATFTALAAFLDLPYTQSMTYCSMFGERDPESLAGNDLGFSTAAVYRTYDEYANDAERAFLEYFMRDAYEKYGYDFHYYNGQPVNETCLEQWIMQFTTLESFIYSAWKENMFPYITIQRGEVELSGEALETAKQEALDRYMRDLRGNWRLVGQTLMRGLRFVNRHGQPLHMMPKLELDEALLERPLYH